MIESVVKKIATKVLNERSMANSSELAIIKSAYKSLQDVLEVYADHKRQIPNYPLLSRSQYDTVYQTLGILSDLMRDDD